MAVLTIDDTRTAAPLAKALVAGGVRAMELALRTPVAVECLRIIRAEVPDMLVGIGTILTGVQMREVSREGAAFGVSPGYSPELIDTALELEFPYAPGVMTPSEVQQAVNQGCPLLKYFPAETSGGTAHLAAMNAPFAHLGLRYIVLGGLTARNAAVYLQDPAVAVLGGSWIAPRPLIAAGDWSAIRANAEQARSLFDATRPSKAN